MVMMAISSRASGCWDSLGCPYGIFFERDPWKRTKIRAVLDRISTGSRTRVPGSRLNGGNPPLVSPMGLVWHQSPPYIPFSFSSTPHRGRSPPPPIHRGTPVYGPGTRKALFVRTLIRFLRDSHTVYSSSVQFSSSDSVDGSFSLCVPPAVWYTSSRLRALRETC